MDTYADSTTSYRADLAYRREQLVAGVHAGRTRRNHRRLRSLQAPARTARSQVLSRTDVARSA